MFHQFRGRKSLRKEVKLEAAKVMKPRSELNPGVWQGDCFPGIDQNRSKSFRRPGMQMLVLWRADSHCPEDRVEFVRCCLTRRRGGAEKHAENIFSGLASELTRLRRKDKTCERGDSGD